MTNAELEREVEGLVEERTARGEATAPSWVVQAIMLAHEGLHGTDKDFYLLCGYEHVRDVVRAVVRRRKLDDDGPDPQLVLPGFKRLQREYIVVRDGEQIIVPLSDMTREEGDQKISELRGMAEGCLNHADELDRWLDARNVA